MITSIVLCFEAWITCAEYMWNIDLPCGRKLCNEFALLQVVDRIPLMLGGDSRRRAIRSLASLRRRFLVSSLLVWAKGLPRLAIMFDLRG
jgi:hypothetical protein